MLEERLSHHQKEHLLDQVLFDFSFQIQSLNLSIQEWKLIEQSCQTYLTDQRLKNLELNGNDDLICSKSEEEQDAESLSSVTDILKPAAKKALQRIVVGAVPGLV